MLDLSHIPTGYGSGDVQIFTCPSTVNQSQWHDWIKPRGKSMFMMLAISGGGGGGGGFTAAAAAARGGGGSGGNSGITRLTGPAIFLPNRLFIQVGAGGIGVGSGGGTAGSGVLSYVAAGISTVTPGTVQPTNIICVSGAVAPVGGGTGTGSAVGALGAAGTIATNATCPLGAYPFIQSFIAGTAGVAGGAVAGAIGPPQAIPTATPFWGATGGAGTTGADFAGGAFTAQADSLMSECRPDTAAAGSNNGAGGYTIWQPFFSYGGGGGAASNAGVGGNGGPGGYGCGGGGGGGGTTGGKGGDGGSGLILIVVW